MLPPEKRRDDFVAFIQNVWLPLHVRDGNSKPTTVAFYQHMIKPIVGYFQGTVLQEISPVDALTKEQAARLFSILATCPLDFRCILQLLITTGMRRGECMGLKWRDIDEKACTISIERNVSYTPESGVIVSTPKTANSIRIIPIMPSTLQLLQQLKQEVQNQHPNTDLKDAFLFPKGNEIFTARDPNSMTRRVKRFMKNYGFPDLSPHDLRHPNVKPKTKILQSRALRLPGAFSHFFNHPMEPCIEAQIYLAAICCMDTDTEIAKQVPVFCYPVHIPAKTGEFENQQNISRPILCRRMEVQPRLPLAPVPFWRFSSISICEVRHIQNNLRLLGEDFV